MSLTGGSTDRLVEGSFAMGTIRAADGMSEDGQSWTAEFTLELTGEGAPAGEFGVGSVTATRINVEPMGTPTAPVESLFPRPLPARGGHHTRRHPHRWRPHRANGQLNRWAPASSDTAVARHDGLIPARRTLNELARIVAGGTVTDRTGAKRVRIPPDECAPAPVRSRRTGVDCRLAMTRSH